MQMTITNKQALSLVKARGMSSSARKAEKKAIFAAIHQEHSIPKTTKLVFFLDNPDNPLYRVIRSKVTKLPLDDGKVAPAAVAQVKPKAKPVAKTVKAPAKTVKAPAKTVKAPAKTPTKAVSKAKPASKAPSKVVAPVSKKAAAKPVAAKKVATKAVAKKVAKK